MVHISAGDLAWLSLPCTVDQSCVRVTAHAGFIGLLLQFTLNLHQIHLWRRILCPLSFYKVCSVNCFGLFELVVTSQDTLFYHFRAKTGPHVTDPHTLSLVFNCILHSFTNAPLPLHGSIFITNIYARTDAQINPAEYHLENLVSLGTLVNRDKQSGHKVFWVLGKNLLVYLFFNKPFIPRQQHLSCSHYYTFKLKGFFIYVFKPAASFLAKSLTTYL